MPSIRLLGVRLLAGLHEIEALLDLAEHQRKILALLRRETRQDFLLLALQARDQLLIQRFALARHAQLELSAIVFVLDSLHEVPWHQRYDSAAGGGFVRPRAMRNVLRTAGVVAEAERCQHAPSRNVQPVALLVFA